MAKPSSKQPNPTDPDRQAAATGEDTFRGLADAIPEAILVHSGKIVFVNPSCVKLLGADSAEQLLGKDIAQFVHPDYLAEALARVQTIQETNKPLPPRENVLVGLKGELLEVETSGIPVQWQGSPAVGVVIRDVRASKHAEREIEAWNQRLEMAQKAGLRIGLWEWELATDGLIWSDEVYRQFGYTRENFGGKAEDFFVRLHPEDRARVEEATQRVIHGGKEFGLQYRVLRPDGTTAWIDSHGVIIREGGTRMIGISIDITEFKNLEQQFLQAQKLEAVGRLAGGVAHDFNNVLMSISSYAELLMQATGDEKKIVQYATRIHEAAMRAGSVTRQLLAFSHKQTLESEPLELDQIIGELANMIPRMLGEDIVLSTDLKAALRRVKLDRGQIEQIIMNLAVNARDAMPKGGRLTISTREIRLRKPQALALGLAAGGAYIVLSVSDTGSGMDAGTKARIFEPFFTTKERGKGTGLGLSTVYGIVKQNGGCIYVYSEPQRGARFEIYLPVSAEAAAAAPLPAREGKYPVAEATETILVVEDDSELRGVTVEFLESVGYTVLQAGNSIEALQQCEGHASGIDVMIADVVMPGLDGVELAKAMRVIYPRICVLLMSGYNVRPSRNMAPEVSLLQKPFTLLELSRKLRDLLDQPRFQLR